MDLRRSDFEALLRERIESAQVKLNVKDFAAVKDHLREDPRYEKVEKEDREYIFKTVLRQVKNERFKSFDAFLTESRNTGYIARNTPTSGPKFDHVKELLQHDLRYSELDLFPEERDKAIVDYIQRL